VINLKQIKDNKFSIKLVDLKDFVLVFLIRHNLLLLLSYNINKIYKTY
jgi:hypothetical protein